MPELHDRLAVCCEQLLLPSGTRCVHCERDAVATIATGADPEPEQMCGEHAAAFLSVAARAVASFDPPAPA